MRNKKAEIGTIVMMAFLVLVSVVAFGSSKFLPQTKTTATEAATTSCPTEIPQSCGSGNRYCCDLNEGYDSSRAITNPNLEFACCVADQHQEDDTYRIGWYGYTGQPCSNTKIGGTYLGHLVGCVGGQKALSSQKGGRGRYSLNGNAVDFSSAAAPIIPPSDPACVRPTTGTGRGSLSCPTGMPLNRDTGWCCPAENPITLTPVVYQVISGTPVPVNTLTPAAPIIEVGTTLEANPAETETISGTDDTLMDNSHPINPGKCNVVLAKNISFRGLSIDEERGSFDCADNYIRARDGDVIIYRTCSPNGINGNCEYLCRKGSMRGNCLGTSDATAESYQENIIRIFNGSDSSKYLYALDVRRAGTFISASDEHKVAFCFNNTGDITSTLESPLTCSSYYILSPGASISINITDNNILPSSVDSGYISCFSSSTGQAGNMRIAGLDTRLYYYGSSKDQINNIRNNLPIHESCTGVGATELSINYYIQ